MKADDNSRIPIVMVKKT